MDILWKTFLGSILPLIRFSPQLHSYSVLNTDSTLQCFPLGTTDSPHIALSRQVGESLCMGVVGVGKTEWGAEGFGAAEINRGCITEDLVPA